jgi:hypothetical protein
VLIEVKTSAKRGRLSLHPGYLRYAETVGLPMLIAWRHLSFWTLFEMRHAKLARVNHNIGFLHAMEENLLCQLAGDFSYRVIPGSAIRMRIEKLREEEKDGSFNGRITAVHLINALGDQVPDIPHLSSLFLIMDDEVEIVDEGRSVVQSFVIRDKGGAEFASRTLPKMAAGLADIHKMSLDWRVIFHDLEHWAHGRGQFRKTIDTAAHHGIVANVIRILPKHRAVFLPSTTAGEKLAAPEPPPAGDVV